MTARLRQQTRAAQPARLVAADRVSGVFQCPKIPVDGLAPRPKARSEAMDGRLPTLKQSTEDAEDADHLPVASL